MKKIISTMMISMVLCSLITSQVRAIVPGSATDSAVGGMIWAGIGQLVIRL